MALTQTPEEGLKVSNAPSDGKFLQYKDSTDKLTWATAADGTMSNVVEDTTPQLGGNLDVQDKVITTDTGTNTHITIKPKGTGQLAVGPGDDEGAISANGTYNLRIKANAAGASGANINCISGANGGIDIQPIGTGNVQVASGKLKVAGNATEAHITAHGTSHLKLNTNEGTNSGEIEIEDGANNDIKITPNGTGDVVIDGLKYPQADGSANQVLKTDGSGQLSWTDMAGGVDGISSSADATAITIDSSERVMIGTTTPGYSAGDDLTIQPPSGSGGITIRTGTSDSGKIYFADGTSGGDQYKGTITYNHADDTLAFASPNGDALTVETDRDVTVEAGNLVMGTAGKGIDFSATTNRGTNNSPSEILDDYEEGEWEIQLYTGYDGDIPTDYSQYNCRYTKIGRFVHITANVRIDDAQTNNNCRFLLSSFPFGFHENSHAGIPVCFYYTNSQTVNAFIASNGYTYWQTTTVGGNNLGENCSWMDSVVNMTLSGCYITATDGGSV